MKTAPSFHRNNWATWVKGILLIVLGSVILIYPKQALLTLALYIGAAVLISGLWLIALALTQRKSNPAWGWILAEGAVDLGLGIILWFHPALTEIIIPWFIGGWAIAVGLLQWFAAQQARQAALPRWWLGLIAGGLSIVLGIMLLFQPLAGALAITFLIGFEIVLYGITTLLLAFQSGRSRNYQ